MCRLCFATGFVLALVWNLGCSSGPKGAAPAANVKGTINRDGKPIPTGEIHFGMTGVPPRVLEIKDGSFSGEAPIGQCQVEVFIYVKGSPPEKDKHGGVRPKTNTVPQRYWGPETTLKATVNESGPNEFKFDIASK
ncbi:MAG: hypothetical protein L0Z62_14015 [Gemmataceae bacterium]|nr:hypothetical protein [Gemmataceae bacterium]